MATESPNLGFALLTEGQAGAHVNVNEFMILSDILWGGIDGLTTATAPPGSPSNGDVRLVVATATGTFTGEEGKVAVYHDGAWSFFALPSIWSTTEVATQLYRDGAQVYKKVLSVTPATTPVGSYYASATAHGITGLDLTKPVVLNGHWLQPGGSPRFSGSQVIAPTGATTQLLASLSIDATNINCGSNFLMTGGWIIDVEIEYSKT